MDGGFLTREYAHVPMWGWIVGGVAVLYFLTTMGVIGGSASATASTGPATTPGPSANTGTNPSDNVFYLPTSGQAGQQYTVNTNRHDQNYYRYGLDEIAYLKSNIGTHGITQDLITAIQGRYDEAARSEG
jgi:hypothetical protein